MDIHKFTCDFLKEFYGQNSLIYFQTEAIAKHTEPNILKRKTKINEIFFSDWNKFDFSQKSEHLKSLQRIIDDNNGLKVDWDYDYEPLNQWEPQSKMTIGDAVCDGLVTLPIEDLFYITRTPIEWILDHHKSDGSDLHYKHEVLNHKYNIRILEWLINDHRCEVK